MKKTNKELKEIYKELDEIFGTKQVNKIKSHIYSLVRKIEDLEKARDNWQNKYFTLKGK